MSPEDFEALFARWRAGDAAGAAAYFDAEGVYRAARREPVSGRAAIAAHWDRFFRGGPEWRFTVHERFCAGDRCAVTYTWEVRAAGGDWNGRDGCAIVRLRGGRIAEWREYDA